MDYISVKEARALSGLRLVLTKGVPGPWGEAAKAVLRARGVGFAAVGQVAAEENEDLVDWTGVRNAPVAVYNDEAPVTGYRDILMLAERLGSGPSLLPARAQERFMCLGIASDLCGPQGFGWQVRLLIFGAMFAGSAPVDLPPAVQALHRAYGFTPEALSAAPQRVAEILQFLDAALQHAQSGYLAGDGLSAADLYWACFSMMISPLPADINPMPEQLRGLYTSQVPDVVEALTPGLIAHRDRIYADHIVTPLDF